MKVMKMQYEETFAEHVAATLAKAQSLGIKATWSTAKHLDALAETISLVVGAQEGGSSVEDTAKAVRDVLGECYNVSAYQQVLAKKFEKTGHFQRQKDRSVGEQLDSMLDKLVADAMKGQG